VSRNPADKQQAGAFDKLDLHLHEELTTPIVEALDHVSKTHAVMEGTADQDLRWAWYVALVAAYTAIDGVWHHLMRLLRLHMNCALNFVSISRSH